MYLRQLKHVCGFSYVYLTGVFLAYEKKRRNEENCNLCGFFLFFGGERVSCKLLCFFFNKEKIGDSFVNNMKIWALSEISERLIKNKYFRVSVELKRVELKRVELKKVELKRVELKKVELKRVGYSQKKKNKIKIFFVGFN